MIFYLLVIYQTIFWLFCPATFKELKSTTWFLIVKSVIYGPKRDSVWAQNFKKGIGVYKAKIEVIGKVLPPNSMKGSRSFLVYVCFYKANSLCKLFLQIVANQIVFDEACLKGFNCLKEKFFSTPIIVSPNQALPFQVMCETSGVVLGAVWFREERRFFMPSNMLVKCLILRRKIIP